MLSQLATDYFARSPVLVFPVVALGLFVAVFVAIGVRTVRTKKPELERMASLPLSD